MMNPVPYLDEHIYRWNYKQTEADLRNLYGCEVLNFEIDGEKIYDDKIKLDFDNGRVKKISRRYSNEKHIKFSDGRIFAIHDPETSEWHTWVEFNRSMMKSIGLSDTTPNMVGFTFNPVTQKYKEIELKILSSYYFHAAKWDKIESTKSVKEDDEKKLMEEKIKSGNPIGKNAPGVKLSKAKKLLKSAKQTSNKGLISFICENLARFFENG